MAVREVRRSLSETPVVGVLRAAGAEEALAKAELAIAAGLRAVGVVASWKIARYGAIPPVDEELSSLRRN